ncbi:MAG: hypothetical protein ACRDZR_11315, partial [Acidimicrobiales bacterium]
MPSPTAPPSPPSSLSPLARWLAHPGVGDAHVLHRLAHLLALVVPALWPLGGAVLGAVLCVVGLRELAAARSARRGRWVAIAPPAEPDPAGGLALWRTLAPLLAERRALA